MLIFQLFIKEFKQIMKNLKMVKQERIVEREEQQNKDKTKSNGYFC